MTEGARQVVDLAQEEARALKHSYIGTEHILLGLLREEEGLAARVLECLDITVERVRPQVVELVGVGEEITSSEQIPFTRRAKLVLELALRESLSLGHNYIGTEHFLLGLVRQGTQLRAENEQLRDCGYQILLGFDVNADKVRNEVIDMLSGPGGRRRAHVEEPAPRVEIHRQSDGSVTLEARPTNHTLGYKWDRGRLKVYSKSPRQHS
jgi:ATP-dependent Clp protease ATP-binding subunit ClpC